MPTICYRCGEDNPPHARICSRCGITLRAAPKRQRLTLRQRWNQYLAWQRSAWQDYLETSKYSSMRTQRWKSQLDFGGYVGLWDRLMALCLDGLICLALFAFTHKILMPLAERTGFMPLEWFFFLTYTLPIFYFSTMESSRLQATVGKLVFGMIVTTEGGVRISLMRAVIRTILKVAFLPFVFVVFMTRKNQALHDLFVATTVMSK